MSTILLDGPKNLATERDSRMLSNTLEAPDLWRMMPFGADELTGGIGTEGDIVYTTEDGVDLNTLWAEGQAALQVWNNHQNGLIQLLSFPVLNEIETVPQV